MYRYIAEALRPDGVFVVGTHYYGVRARLNRLKKSGYYEGTQLYRLYMTRRDVSEEISSYFGRVWMRPTQVVLPFSVRLRLPFLKVSRIVSVYRLKEFGLLLTVVAQQPTPTSDIATATTPGAARNEWRAIR